MSADAAQEVRPDMGRLAARAEDEHVVGAVEGQARPGHPADPAHELAVVGGKLELQRFEVSGRADRLLDVAARIRGQLLRGECARYGREVADPGEAPQRPVVGEQLGDQAGAAFGVGEHGEREATLGHHQEAGVLTGPGWVRMASSDCWVSRRVSLPGTVPSPRWKRAYRS